MVARHYRHIALTEPLARFVERQVADGRHASAGEAMRAGLRLLIEREEEGACPAKEDGKAHE